MAKYGYIENGVLHTKEFEGNAPEGFKPVDAFDFSKMKADDDNYIIKATPYDAGDRISYQYDKKFDTKKVETQIAKLKTELSDSDYQIIKCYEATLIQGEAPYDIGVLHSERQALRDKINDLENKLLNA